MGWLSQQPTGCVHLTLQGSSILGHLGSGCNSLWAFSRLDKALGEDLLPAQPWLAGMVHSTLSSRSWRSSMRRRPAPATGYFRVQLGFRHGLTCHHMSPRMNVAVYLATAIYDRDACWSDRHWAGNSPQCGRAFVFCGEGRRSRFLPQMYIYIYTHTHRQSQVTHLCVCVCMHVSTGTDMDGWMDQGEGREGYMNPFSFFCEYRALVAVFWNVCNSS